MNQKVVLVLVDGMRPDGIEQCGSPFLLDLKNQSTASFCASSVMPSVTLPCHTSLFLGVDPDRHGILTNTWAPQVRPIDGICETVNKAGKSAAMIFNWEQLRDLSSPGSLHFSHFEKMNGADSYIMQREQIMTDIAIDYLYSTAPDFLFLYLGFTDEAGHHYGWMSDPYLAAIRNASDCIQKLKTALPDDYQLIITADHGGHARSHGTDLPEDMRIPMIFNGSAFQTGKELSNVNLKDIAPTIATLLHLPQPAEWEGTSVV